MQLNAYAARLCETLISEAQRYRVTPSTLEGSYRIIDCGLAAKGGLEAGQMLAAVCLADLAQVRLVPARADLWSGPAVLVTTDHPVAACMASQYAGWEIKAGKFFAMGSGPMRLASGHEPVLAKLGFAPENSGVAVGVLEAGKLPTPEACAMIAQKCRVEPENLILLVAPTRSQAGTVQIVARSVETALHKLDTLGFDLKRVESGYGIAPLPPAAADDLTGIGRTNDAILYGAEVTLYVRGDDESLQRFGTQIPSCNSRDHGQPFAAIFEKYGRDFYKIDPELFSPAVLTLVNLDSGRSYRFGHLLPRVIHESFGLT